MERYMAHLLKGAEYRPRQFMGSQVKNPASLQYGGIKGDIWEAKPTIYALPSSRPLTAGVNVPTSSAHRPTLRLHPDAAVHRPG